MCLLSGVSLRVHRLTHFDYSQYLGQKKADTPKHVSTYVSNHQSWMDIVSVLSILTPAFAAKKVLAKIPVFGLLCKAIGCIFIPRGAS